MTNTRITDVEVLEHRYPVRVLRFALRRGSGGSGAQRGGDGLIRELEYLQPATVSLLAQSRLRAPRGAHGGAGGLPGGQLLRRVDGTVEVLSGNHEVTLGKGDTLRLETPGGGGWGAATNALRARLASPGATP
jgi:5-oxoprolinase (ATP-hydrolysing)